MAATFRTRPWKLLLRPPASRTLPFASSCSRTPTTSFASRTPEPSNRRGYRKLDGLGREGKKVERWLHSKENSLPSITRATALEQRQLPTVPVDMFSTKLPFTFVSPPAGAYFASFRTLRKLLWIRLKRSVTDLFHILLYKFGSKPGWFKRPVFRINRSSIVPTAKALHRSLNEALARGDTNALQKICVREMAYTLSAGVSKRPPGRRFEWELVKYTRPLLFPRIVDHKVRMLPPLTAGSPVQPVLWQVVVGIASRQRRVEVDDKKGGAVVPGSEKEKDVLEYITIVSSVNNKTHKASEWRVLGFTKPTSLKAWEWEQAAIKVLENADQKI